MENRLSDKKAQGIPSYGTFTQLKSAAAIENIACAPFDFVVIDTEHQAIGTDLMASAVASAQGASGPHLRDIQTRCPASAGRRRRRTDRPRRQNRGGGPSAGRLRQVRPPRQPRLSAYPGLPVGFFVLLFPGILYGGGQPENVIDPAV